MVYMWRKGDEIIRNGVIGTKVKSKELVVSCVKCKYENKIKVWIGCKWYKETLFW